MSYTLFSINDVQCIKFLKRDTWEKLIALSQLYGWEPQGTLLKVSQNNSNFFLRQNHKDWDGNYWMKNDQIVTAEDATAIANALDAALDDIPNVNTREKERDLNKFEYLIGFHTLSSIVDDFIAGNDDPTPGVLLIHPLDYFSGEMKHVVIDFIKFCKKGAFRIY